MPNTTTIFKFRLKIQLLFIYDLSQLVAGMNNFRTCTITKILRSCDPLQKGGYINAVIHYLEQYFEFKIYISTLFSDKVSQMKPKAVQVRIYFVATIKEPLSIYV